MAATTRASLLAGLILISRVYIQGQTQMPPVEAWKAAVMSGDRATLAKLYSPGPLLMVGKEHITLQDELAYWVRLKNSGMTEFNPRVLEVTTNKNTSMLLLRISITSGGVHKYAEEQQLWARLPAGWKIVGSQRNGAFAAEASRRLPQPVTPNTNLYADPHEAQAELNAGLAKAAKERKRVIVIFGGNWCYDCHVLDTTFHSKEFAPLVDANYVVVHINVGDDGLANNDLAARLGVAVDKGVPSLGVLDPDGKVVYAQKNGEFESTVKIGPEDVRAFLEKWKPRRG
jgi:hypothetical protein